MNSIIFVTLCLVVLTSSLPVEEIETPAEISPEAKNILNVLSISDAVQDDVVRQKRQFGYGGYGGGFGGGYGGGFGGGYGGYGGGYGGYGGGYGGHGHHHHGHHHHHHRGHHHHHHHG